MRRRNRFSALLALAVASTLAGCASDSTETSDDGVEAQTASDGWVPLGVGVAYKHIGDGPNVFIGYGGYTAKMDWSRGWVTELHRARLDALGVGHVYAVQGPRYADYSGAEIQNSRLGAHLLAGPAPDAAFVLVAAHSSGSYVAQELLRQLHGPNPTDAHGVTDHKIVYANLDGGYGLEPGVTAHLRRVAYVWAEDATISSGRSANAGVMQELARSTGGANIRVKADGSGCNPGARWCLHDTVITTKPHNPGMYDLLNDYTRFDGRAVQLQWVEALADELR